MTYLWTLVSREDAPSTIVRLWTRRVVLVRINQFVLSKDRSWHMGSSKRMYYYCHIEVPMMRMLTRNNTHRGCRCCMGIESVSGKQTDSVVCGEAVSIGFPSLARSGYCSVKQQEDRDSSVYYECHVWQSSRSLQGFLWLCLNAR